MNFQELVRAARSVRRYRQDSPLRDGVSDMETLNQLVDMSRLTPSAANKQPLKYILCAEPETNQAVFATLGWAGYLPRWPGPDAGERPRSYIVITLDTSIADSPDCDHGIAAQTIMLGAAAQGIGCCMLGNVNREKLSQSLDIPNHLKILLVLALGRPAESVILEQVDQDIKYWRDIDDTHHVPKRALEDVVLRRIPETDSDND